MVVAELSLGKLLDTMARCDEGDSDVKIEVFDRKLHKHSQKTILLLKLQVTGNIHTCTHIHALHTRESA